MIAENVSCPAVSFKKPLYVEIHCGYINEEGRVPNDMPVISKMTLKQYFFSF